MRRKDLGHNRVSAQIKVFDRSRAFWPIDVYTIHCRTKTERTQLQWTWFKKRLVLAETRRAPIARIPRERPRILAGEFQVLARGNAERLPAEELVEES